MIALRDSFSDFAPVQTILPELKISVAVFGRFLCIFFRVSKCFEWFMLYGTPIPIQCFVTPSTNKFTANRSMNGCFIVWMVNIKHKRAIHIIHLYSIIIFL